jgi:hypothetical protein
MNSVESILLENIDNPNALFVFPTDVAASQWADHLLRLQGGGTVAMDKFTAWDTFKRNSIKSRMQDKEGIPPVMRKIFVSRLIRENAELCKLGREPVFSSLIRAQYAQQAASFAGWITDMLPQLGSWLRQCAGLRAASIAEKNAEHLAEKFEGDERDFFILAIRYAQFLEAYSLFEPAWETPPFENSGKECFIFFPESLFDYNEYRELLADSGHVKTVSVSQTAVDERPFDVFFYANSRSEITEAVLYIRALHEQRNIPWNSIVVSMPGDEDYEPYLLREFSNRNVPCVKRTGKPLASYPAGRFFASLAECASRDFAFSALAGLILNRHLPWRDDGDIQALVDFGIKNNCISSWTEEEDGKEKPLNVWEDAFARPYGGISPSARHFFHDLKWRVNALRHAASFAEIRRSYFAFRERFFDMEKCLPETDLVLSRCISELMYLVEIEKSFPGVQPPDPYMFFVEYLGEVHYLAQQPVSGVVILPYRTAAPAPFDCHVILGADQDNLSAVFSRLNFLPGDRRKKLGIADEDASAVFINLHRLNSRLPAAFFCSEQGFSGYAIPHSRLGAPSKPRRRYSGEPEYREKFGEDLYRAEDDFFRTRQGGRNAAAFPERLHENQHRGFQQWYSRRMRAEQAGSRWFANEALLELIRRRFCGNQQFPGKCSVSASSLAPYFQCSLKWLFARVLDLENVETETGLMKENIAGLVYHAVLNLFFDELKKKGEALSAPVDSLRRPGLPAAYLDLLVRCVDTVFAGLPCLPGDSRPVMSSLSARMLRAGQKQFFFRLENFLAVFLSWFAGFLVKGSETMYHAERDFGFLKGTVDCILEDASDDSATRGTSVIIDFKLKNMPTRDDCTGGEEGKIVDFQLPMYITLAEEREKVSVRTALFFSIIDTKPEVLFGLIQNVLTGACIPPKEEDRIMGESGLFGQIMEEFSVKTEQFARETGSGEFTVFPSGSEECIGCNYNRVCRTIYKIDREQNLTSWGNIDGG